MLVFIASREVKRYFFKRQFILSQNEQELRYCNLHGTKHTKHRTEENPKEQEASTL